MRVLTLGLAALTLGCNGGEPEPEAPTYHADVRPLLDQYCVRCHQEGGLGVGDWTDDQLVDAFAELIADRVATGEMPPAVSDPECRDYVGSEQLSVPDSAKDTIQAWIDAGRPMGDPADTPEMLTIEDDLDSPDVTFMMPEPYTPTFSDPDNPGNEYRCFLIDPGEQEIYVNAMDPVVGNNELVHHVVLNSLDRDDVRSYMEDPQGWDCIDNMDGDGMLAGWAPGALPVQFPEGYNMRFGRDRLLVLQMHYYQGSPENAGQSDQSGYAFKTDPTMGREIYMVPLGIFDFMIPAGDSEYTSLARYRHADLGIPIPIQVHGVFPHMHRLGTDYNMKLIHEDDTESCMVNGRYDFDNQITYQFADTTMFRPGDRLEFSCTWDNSADNPNQVEDPKDTRYGERTDEEMCFFFTLVSAGEP